MVAWDDFHVGSISCPWNQESVAMGFHTHTHTYVQRLVEIKSSSEAPLGHIV